VYEHHQVDNLTTRSHLRFIKDDTNQYETCILSHDPQARIYTKMRSGASVNLVLPVLGLLLLGSSQRLTNQSFDILVLDRLLGRHLVAGTKSAVLT
jgi:hypothetical protein